MNGPRAASSRRDRLSERLLEAAARAVEVVAMPVDRALARRTRVLDRIPTLPHRQGGKRSYAEWAWVIGLLQALVGDLLDGVDEPEIVDVGCGSGLVLIAAENSVADGGRLLGLDVQDEAIEFCRRHYPSPPYRFAALPDGHPLYAAHRPDGTDPGPGSPRWPVASDSVDLVTALSVLTHLRREEAGALLDETARVLRPGASALVSVFLVDPEVDDLPVAGSPPSDPRPGSSRFHRTDPRHWRFDRTIDEGWFSPSWADPPERAIGLTRAALDDLATGAGLTVERVRPGTWRERRGLYFQDLVVLRAP